MTVLRFSGVVAIGDPYRCDDVEPHGAVLIDGDDVVAEVDNAKWSDAIRVGLADERWEGPLSIEIGWGYSEWTPMDADKLFVGPNDVLAILAAHEGESVTLWIGDEPFNIAAP